MVALCCTKNENTVFSVGLKRKHHIWSWEATELKLLWKELSGHEPSFNHKLNEKVQSRVSLEGAACLPLFLLAMPFLPPVFVVELFGILHGGGSVVVLRQGLTMCELPAPSQKPKQGTVTFSQCLLLILPVVTDLIMAKKKKNGSICPGKRPLLYTRSWVWGNQPKLQPHRPRKPHRVRSLGVHGNSLIKLHACHRKVRTKIYSLIND